MTATSLISHLVDLSIAPTRQGWISVAVRMTNLAVGAGVLWLVYLGRHRNLAPPGRAAFGVALLSWVALLLQRL